MPSRSIDISARLLWGLLALLLLARLVTMAWVPLMDTTEARYAEIGRKMAELGDWVTPWFDYGVPFWGKPPLSFWMTALSFQLFGVNEFTARLPHLLCGLGIIAFVWRFACRWLDARQALLCLSLLAGSALFLVSAGAVMTDTALLLCLTWAMCSFWEALHAETKARQRLQAAGFFAAIGLGLLAKGPVMPVLVALSLAPWLWRQRCWGEAWRRLPILGGLLTAVIALPWYFLAESRTPGFLSYFLLGEHWHRFLTPGWRGDLYGHAHRHMPGTIWLFALMGLLPWIVLLPLAIWRSRAGRESPVSAAGDARALPRGLSAYLLWWALIPLLFFSAARNIIPTYVLPAMPAAALWAGNFMHRRVARPEAWAAAGLLSVLVVGVTYMVYAGYTGDFERRTARAIVQACAMAGESDPARPLFFIGNRPYSASFYSRGHAAKLRPQDPLPSVPLGDRGICLALPAGQALSAPPGSNAVKLGRFGKWDLDWLRAQGLHDSVPPPSPGS
jgi:4-amino-4-deoxy-L-arabinose transferase-like glycosyltransferase